MTRIRRRTLVALAVFAMPLCLTFYAAGAVLQGFSGSGRPPADCVMVFGAAIRKGDQPGPGIRRRMDTAIDLYRRGMVRHILVSGGVGPGVDVSEAQVMALYAIDHGVPSSVLTLEGESRSTVENLAFSKPLLVDCSDVLGISDRYHLARIELLAWRSGWGSLPTYPARERASHLFELQSVLRETVGYMYYMLRLDLFWDIAPRV